MDLHEVGRAFKSEMVIPNRLPTSLVKQLYDNAISSVRTIVGRSVATPRDTTFEEGIVTTYWIIRGNNNVVERALETIKEELERLERELKEIAELRRRLELLKEPAKERTSQLEELGIDVIH